MTKSRDYNLYQWELSGRQYLVMIDDKGFLFNCNPYLGTVFQTVISVAFKPPETSSRVTLAVLGIGFQPNPANVTFICE